MATIHFSSGASIDTDASADQLEEVFISDSGSLRQGLVPIGPEGKSVRINPWQITFISDE
ncbi:MAG: hypothetical protein M3088_05585 [Actinomycetota bacterium]|nr:hypothetical protein [Actinomycetota bacterium]